MPCLLAQKLPFWMTKGAYNLTVNATPFVLYAKLDRVWEQRDPNRSGDARQRTL